MRQPFNGLEVFDPIKLTFSFDRSLFEAPPALCKKGGALIRIKCDDNGHYDGDDFLLLFYFKKFNFIECFKKKRNNIIFLFYY